MPYFEADLVPLSALQHYMFCPRQCALIHVEQIWEENRHTAEGRLMHEKVHAGGSEKRRDVRRAFGLPIRSLRLGLSGKTDVVEFHRQPDGLWRPYPVEYKRGRRKEEDWDRVQLCAQAICLEEMLDVSVPEGALFYGAEQRREVVPLEKALRKRTEEVAQAVHDLVAEGRTPPHDHSPACKTCSLYARCLPGTGGRSGKRVARYIERMTVEP